MSTTASNDLSAALRSMAAQCAQGALVAAADTAQGALATVALNAEASAVVGDACVRLALFTPALAAYQQALDLQPARAVYWFNRAAVRRFLGQLEESESDYDRCLQIDPHDGQAWLNRSDLRVQTTQRNHVEALSGRVQAGFTTWRQEVPVRYALAKELEDLGEYQAAWFQLSLAARVRRQHLQYDLAADVETADALIQAFPQRTREAAHESQANQADQVSARPGHVAGQARYAAAQPVFILGMPRTGSTLLDRMLASHTRVRSAGELNQFAHAVVASARAASPTAANRMELIAACASIDNNALGQDYLNRTYRYRIDTDYFIDKMPLNYLYCGLIDSALPTAPIIHMTRHPLATCYGVFKVLFDQGYPFSYDLMEIADYFIAYHRLMAHWETIMPGRLLEIRYEDLVAAAQPTCQRALEHVGLPWEPDCLAFHRNPAPTTTASAAQVRRPIYESAVSLWEHYAEELEPVRRRLKAAGIRCT